MQRSPFGLAWMTEHQPHGFIHHPLRHSFFSPIVLTKSCTYQSHIYERKKKPQQCKSDMDFATPLTVMEYKCTCGFFCDCCESDRRGKIDKGERNSYPCCWWLLAPSPQWKPAIMQRKYERVVLVIVKLILLKRIETIFVARKPAGREHEKARDSNFLFSLLDFPLTRFGIELFLSRL